MLLSLLASSIAACAEAHFKANPKRLVGFVKNFSKRKVISVDRTWGQQY